MRQANVLGLTWNQVDLDRKVCWYHPDEIKAGNVLGVVLNDTAVEVLKRQIGKHKKFVFVNKLNKPISGINSQYWKKMLELAEIEDFYLARFQAHLGKLVSSAWRTIESVARSVWLEDVKDGAEIRTFGS